MTDAVASGLCTLDDAGLVSYMNPAAERLLGWSSVELRGRTLHDAIHAGTHSIAQCPIQAGHRARKTVSFEADTFVLRDGSALPVAWVLTPVRTQGGHSSVIVITDMSAGTPKQQPSPQAPPRGDRELLERVRVLRELQAALAEQRLELFAQPTIDLRTGAVVSHELLLRLRERDGTIRAAGWFLAAAEYSGAIHELDRWVIGEAARLAGAGYRVELNLSAESLAHDDLIDHFIASISAHGADPARLVVDLKEAALTRDETVRTFIHRLRGLGCEFALDDFGGGLATFQHLERLPIGYLKIDHEFVREVRTSDASRRAVEAVVALARAFGQRTVAAGVEDLETLQTLRMMGIGYAQGYLTGRPAPLAATLENLVPGARTRISGALHGDDAQTGVDRADAVAALAAQDYGEALRSGDPHTAASVIDRAVGDGLTSVEIQSRVIAPAMWRIGELWQRQLLTVAQEHLATAVSHHVLGRLYPGLLGQAPRRGESVIVASVQGEGHVLGLRMAADVFDGAGFKVRFLGADVPEESLLALVAEHQPAIVALGVTLPASAPWLIRSLRELRDRGPDLRLIVGGQGVPTCLRDSADVFYAVDTERLAEHLVERR